MSQKTQVFVGVDVGSASVNVVGVDRDGHFVGDPIYVKVANHPTPVDALKFAFQQYLDSAGDIEVAGAGTTGSGRELNKHILGADITRTEIFAHAIGISTLAKMGKLVVGENGTRRVIEKVGTVIEIGGQDAKVIVFDDAGTPAFFNMNSICSAGTGEFLQQIADEAGIKIQEFGPIALTSNNPVHVDTTCTVFSKRDFRHLTQKGVPLNDRLWGLCHAMVHNYTHNVIGGNEIRKPVIMQGGVAANEGVRRAFEIALGTEVIRPPYYDVMGAFGMAIIVRDIKLGLSEHDESRLKQKSAFKPDFMQQTFSSQMKYCHGCPNSCELTQPLEVRETETIVLDTMGGRCEGWTKPGNMRDYAPKENALNVPVNRIPRPAVNCFDIVRPGLAKVRDSDGLYFAGIDGGSRGTKVALIKSLGDEVEVVEVLAFSTGGNAMAALMKGLEGLREKIQALEAQGEKVVIGGFGTTGSAGELFRDVITTKADRCSDYRSTEILAHYAWASYQVPQVGTVMDIGGNDAKIISVKDNGLDFAMNDKCAAGTGSFLEAVAKRFDVPLENYAQVAFESRNPARIAGRCAVFGESDIVHKSRVGTPKEDLFMGLAYSICRTYFADVAKGKEIRVPIVMQGGTFLNEAVQRAFKEMLQLNDEELIIYPDRRFILNAGALGAALLAKGMYERGYDSHFKGFDVILRNEYKSVTTSCEYAPCYRKCKGVVALLENGRVISGYKSIDCDFGMFDGLVTNERNRAHMQSRVELALSGAFNGNGHGHNGHGNGQGCGGNGSGHHCGCHGEKLEVEMKALVGV
ncbi:MAG: acyl-CoA dehydratase activase [Abditibacteriales bacterium]|nr:acyl-CoA dehydratase activase [Abditibacteriales bacterium]MDW8367055.1 acyl-CoA dehydratase activase [Abditibacteriales bacterium]